jgi:hypothetical protein
VTSTKALWVIALLTGGAYAQTISLPGAQTVPAINPSGTSFTYSGTLTQAATLSFTQTGLACEQASSTYCTNAAGVVVVAGSTGVGGTSTFSGTFGGTAGTWNFGALLMTISGVGTAQVLPANAGNGLGSGTPPSSLSLNGATLSSLGFSHFSVVNPTITFVVADNNYGDNSGLFTLTPTGAPAATPAPSTLLLSLTGGAALALLIFSKRVFRSA